MVHSKAIARKLSTICFFLTLACCLFPENFLFKYKKGQQYRITGRIQQQVYIDDQLAYTGNTLNRVSVKVLNTKEDRGLLSWVFRISEKLEEGAFLFKWRDETLKSQFWRDRKGKFGSSGEYLMPVVRDMPLFPDKELKVGDTWSATGAEYHDFRPWGFEYPAHNTMEVNYIYLRDDVVRDQKVAVLKIYYISEGNFEKYLKYNSAAPEKIIGFSDQLLYWNIALGRLEGYEDKFNVRYFYANGRVQQFRGTVIAEVTESTPMDKEKMLGEINGYIKDEEIKDVDIEKTSDGVVIRLENIQFEPESDLLMPREQEKLKKIANILKKYPERDLFITGHTALAGTEEGRQQLSEKRARIAGEFLLSLGVRKAPQITYQGFGARIPLADNTTEEGMKRNRRVEITILEN